LPAIALAKAGYPIPCRSLRSNLLPLPSAVCLNPIPSRSRRSLRALCALCVKICRGCRWSLPQSMPSLAPLRPCVRPPCSSLLAVTQSVAVLRVLSAPSAASAVKAVAVRRSFRVPPSSLASGPNPFPHHTLRPSGPFLPRLKPFFAFLASFAVSTRLRPSP